ncbi:MAG TPA: LamG domain-containing protein, partial [Kiritimatiellia bacterium]|nr:LamG domain-containing protein [Kiritimatiellia bacterium]HMP00247.1 LamG domain-containing protein [Kiritimatiellia bacterium]
MKKQRCSIFIVSCLLLYTFHVARAADTVGPVLICPADITVLCGDSDAPSTTGTPVVSDDSGKFCLNYVDSIVPGECPTVWIILREWLATDAAGNVSRCEQVITVTDATPPVLSGVPADVEVECGSVPPPALVSARDGCDACSRESLVLYYAFDHDNGAFVEDTSGYGNHGIATGGTFSPDGRLGGARYFNGSDDFIFVPASESLTIGGSITLAVWFKPVHYVFHGQLPIVEWNNGTRAGVHLWSNVHGYQWQGKGTGANLVDVTGNEINHVISTDNPPPQEWHHLVVTYDRESGLARLYLNGELTVEKNLGSMTLQTAYDLFIGTRPSQNDAWFFGWLDEVRVYNRALSPREIEALHASGDCRVHLRFEEFREGECPAAVIRVWSATDACGNTASATQVITVTASSRIALNGVPADMTVECGSEPAPARVTATSRCLPHGLALYYPFDEDSGDITVDFSGNNRTGTVNGATWIEDGARGGAYRFDAINQNITADDAGLPSGNSARTLAMWVKLDSLYSDDSTEYFSYGTRNYNQLTSLGIDWRNNRDRFNFSQYGGVFLSQQQIDRESEWYHVVYTYDGSHQFYINGNSSSGMNELWGPLNTTLSGVLMLGGHPQNGGSLGPDGGYLDEVMVFNRAL